MAGRNVGQILKEFREKQAQGLVPTKPAQEAEKRKSGGAARSTTRQPRAARAAGSKQAAVDLGTGHELPTSLAQAAEAKEAAQREALARKAQYNAPLGKLVKDIIQCLRAADGAPLSAAHVHAAVGVELASHPALLAELRANAKVQVVGGPQADSLAFSYKATHDIRTATQLLAFVQQQRQGVHIAEVADSYKGITDDMQSLAREGKLLVLWSMDSGAEVLYPVEQACTIKVDDDIIEQWHGQEVPQDPIQLEAELKKAGLKAAPRRLPRRRIDVDDKKKKKRRQVAPRVITNVHMPELFTAPQPDQID